MTTQDIEDILELGFNVLPLKTDKTPNIRSWTRLMTEFYDEPITDTFIHVGIVCGKISGGLEVIDIDTKYDLDGNLIERLKKIINYQKAHLWGKLTIAETRSGGLHLLYRTSVSANNMKLASRPATEEEQKESQETTKVLIETRGQGGYIVGVPSEGYKFLQGDYSTVPDLTDEERDILISSSIACDKMPMDVFKASVPAYRSKGQSPWDAYNEQADVVEFLCSQGWSVHREYGERVLLKRPGATETKYSGNYHRGLRLFTCHSSSQPWFEPGKAYNPMAVYTMVMCNGDFSQSARELLALGYGELPEKEFQNDIETFTDEFQITDYLADKPSDDEMIRKFRKGEIEMGVPLGWEDLDRHWVFKEGQFVIGLGHDNVGKSTIIWYKAVVLNLKHGVKTMIYSSENAPWVIKMKMCEFAIGKNSKMWTDKEEDTLTSWFDNNFDIIHSEEPFAYNQILDVADYLIGKSGHKMLVIDPYNTLAYNFEGLDRRLSTHDYHHHVASTFKRWAMKNNCTIFLNTHAVTEAMRMTHQKGEMKGYVKPPLKSHAEGGGKWAAKADDFIIYHRYTNHPDKRRVIEMHVAKIKEEWKGGQPTLKDTPVELTYTNPNGDFVGFYDDNKRNPIKHLFNDRYLDGVQVSASFNSSDKFYSNSTLRDVGKS